MSRSRNKRNKERRRKIFREYPGLKVVARFIRHGLVPKYQRVRAPSGNAVMRFVPGSNRSKVYLRPWAIQSTFDLEFRKAFVERLKAQRKAEAKA